MNPENVRQDEIGLDETIITKAIVENYTRDFLEYTDVDVAIVGGGPSGLAAGYYLGKAGVKTALFERKLSIGGGMWGGGMMFNKIVVQTLGKEILDEFGITASEYQKVIMWLTRLKLYLLCAINVLRPDKGVQPDYCRGCNDT